MNYWPRQVVMGSTNDHRVAGSNPGSSRLHVEVMVKSNHEIKNNFSNFLY